MIQMQGTVVTRLLSTGPAGEGNSLHNMQFKHLLVDIFSTLCAMNYVILAINCVYISPSHLISYCIVQGRRKQ